MSAPLIVPAADVHVEPGLNARSAEVGDLASLRDSIARHGILQPLLVRSREDGGFWLIAGHRRLAAAQQAGLADVPVMPADGERLELTAVENLQRVDLTPLEEAGRSGRWPTRAIRRAGSPKRSASRRSASPSAWRSSS